MEILGFFILPLLIAVGIYCYSLYCRFKKNIFAKQIRNFMKFCKDNGWILSEETCDRIVFRRDVSSEQIAEIEKITGININIPNRCHLFEYYFVTNSPEWQERCEFIVKHHGGLELHHNFIIEIDGLYHTFIGSYRSINQIAKGDEFKEWNYNYFLQEDKKSSYFELAEIIYPKRMDDYHKFMKHLKLEK